jgi:hypothetical protein
MFENRSQVVSIYLLFNKIHIIFTALNNKKKSFNISFIRKNILDESVFAIGI